MPQHGTKTNKDEQRIETLCEQVEEILKERKIWDIIIIMGDLNAKIGKGKTNNLVDKFDLEDRKIEATS